MMVMLQRALTVFISPRRGDRRSSADTVRPVDAYLVDLFSFCRFSPPSRRTFAQYAPPDGDIAYSGHVAELIGRLSALLSKATNSCQHHA